MDVAQIPTNTLLESGDLPLEDLARFASREGRRPRAIYQIHKWFARRLGCSFRALLVGAVEASTSDFWKAYYAEANLTGLTVLDPFVGGGTSVVEAARLGASAIGVDVDPIACAVTNAELNAAALDDLAPTLRSLQDRVGNRLASLHATRAHDGRRLAVVHHFWVQVVKCPECKVRGEAHPNFVLAEEPATGRWGFCRCCHEIRRLTERQSRFMCRACGAMTDLNAPPVTGGAYKCHRCEHRVPLIELGRKTDAPPRWRLFALEVCHGTAGRAVPLRERHFRKATAADQRAVTRARRELQKLLRRDRAFLPAQRIRRQDRTDSRLTAYGYREWTQLFNDRQLLHLGLLARELRRLPLRQRAGLGLAFSNHLTTNCMLTSYAAGWRRATPLFSIRAFRHVPRPIEVNPWAENTGRGTFPNAVRQVLRAAAFARAPKEPMRRGGFRTIGSIAPRAVPRVSAGNARDLSSVKTASVDLVLTDPPYYDNVAYSELSDFFQPWLEHIGLVPSERTRRTLVRNALRARRQSDDSRDTFAAHLGQAFAEIARALKPDGMLVFTFRHSTADGWYAMAVAVARGGLRPVQVMPIPGEAGNALHTHEGTSLWDAVLVFRKRPAPPPVKLLSKVQMRAAKLNAAGWRDRLHRHGKLPFTKTDFVNLHRASLVAASLGLYNDGGAAQRTPLRVAIEAAAGA